MNIKIVKRLEQTRFLTTLALAVRGEEWREQIKPLLEDDRLQYEELYHDEFGTYYRARVPAETAPAMYLTHEGETLKVTVDVVIAPEGDMSRFEKADYIIFLIRYRAPRHVQLWFRPANTEREGYFVVVDIETIKAIIRDLFTCDVVKRMLSPREEVQ